MRRCLLAAICVLLGTPGVAAATALPASGSTLPAIHHVFVIFDENESESTTFGSGSQMPYLSKTLVSEGAFVPNYYGIGHNSLDNYIATVSGQAPNTDTSADCQTYADFPADSMTSSGQENGAGCVYPADVPTLMSQLDSAGLTWRGYEDSMGKDPAREAATCGHPTVGQADGTQVGENAAPYDEYATRHDPFVYFHYVIDNSKECNANVVNLSQLSTDLASASTTPNFSFITPDLCDDGHDATCRDPSRQGGPAGADAFLQKVVPEITASPAYQQGGLLIVTFDEAASSDATACCNEQPGPEDPNPGITGPGGGKVGAVLLSPFITGGTVTQTAYNHYSLLGTVEDLFGLTRIAYANGATAFGSDVFTNTGNSGGGGGGGGGGGSTVSTAVLRSDLQSQLSPKGHGARIRTLRKKHSYSAKIAAPEAGTLSIKWTIRVRRHHHRVNVTIATGKVSFSAAGSQTIRISLNGAGRRALRKAHRLSVTVHAQFTPSTGTGVSIKRTAVLKR